MDKYLHFSSEDFAVEESFINWVKNSNPQDINYWNKWLLDHPEKKGDVAAAKKIIESINFDEPASVSARENAIWERITSNIDNSRESSKPKSSILKYLLPLAAAAIAGILVFVNLPSAFSCDTFINTELSIADQIALPDQSVITLNAESELCYSKENWAKHRIVKLEGEAFFEVEKGSKFTVQTDHGEVEVLGTSFNVYSRSGQLFVECETGKVQVRSKDRQVILIPNESVIFNSSENIVEKSVMKSRRSEWRNGTFNYEGARIDHVLQDIERIFEVDIDLSMINATELYTGKFTAQDIETVLYNVLWPLNLEAVKERNIYKIHPSNK